jgi:hypothetical protein
LARAVFDGLMGNWSFEHAAALIRPRLINFIEKLMQKAVRWTYETRSAAMRP